MARAHGRHSAGLLAYRLRDGRCEVLLVHPGGPYWARRDEGAWSIPKGEYTADEPALQAARREFREETGFEACGPFIALPSLTQPGGKHLAAWAVRVEDFDPAQLRSNCFTLEWPPHSGQQREFPEVDRAGWFALPQAQRKLLAGQRALLQQLDALLR